MPSENPNLEAQAIPVQSKSMKTTAESEMENQVSEKTMKDRRKSKKSNSDEELGHEFHERWGDSSSLFTEATGTTTSPTKIKGTGEDNSSGRERLKRHRVDVAGRVWIPEMWGQEDFLRDCIDCTAFDVAVRNTGIMSARASLMEEGRRSNATRFRIENRC